MIKYNANSQVKQNNIPRVLRGFEHIHRYFDKQLGYPVAKLIPGEYYVSMHDEMISTVLGSCISVCIRDPKNSIGGMNHFMLPNNNARKSKNWGDTLVSSGARYGNIAMEQLINTILAHDGKRERLEIKVFGGGKVLKLTSDIGGKNINFVKQYLIEEGLTITSEDVSGIYPRRVQYFPSSGRVRIKEIRSTKSQSLIRQEMDYINKLKSEKVAGSVDIFDRI